jgi:hypothetical protein
MTDKDDDFTKVDDEIHPTKKLNRLEQEEISYQKAYKKLYLVMIISTIFIVV